MATGIRDKVAIVGMGCSRFGERWDCGPDDLMLEAFNEALADAGLRTRGVANDLWLPNASAPGAFAQLASAYAAKHGVAMADLKRAMAHISVKSHANAALNPKAHLRKLITEDEVLRAATIAAPLGLYDCCGVSDGAACAIVTTPEIARAAAGRGADHPQGGRGLGQQWRGAELQQLGRRPHRHRPHRRRPGLCGSRHQRPAGANPHGRGA